MSRIACLVLALVLGMCAVGCSAKVEPKSVAELTEMLRDPDPAVQSEAAYQLSRLGPESLPALSALIEALKSKNTSVRQNAALALGLIGPTASGAVPALTDALRDPEYGVRMEAANALGNIGSAASSAIPELEKFGRGHDPCKSASSALKKIRS
jgi:HEAT repeat protein